MKKHITRDRVGEFVQAVFSKGLDVYVYQNFLTVRSDGGNSVYVDIVENVTFEGLVQSVMEEVSAKGFIKAE